LTRFSLSLFISPFSSICPNTPFFHPMSSRFKEDASTTIANTPVSFGFTSVTHRLCLSTTNEHPQGWIALGLNNEQSGMAGATVWILYLGGASQRKFNNIQKNGRGTIANLFPDEFSFDEESLTVIVPLTNRWLRDNPERVSVLVARGSGGLPSSPTQLAASYHGPHRGKQILDLVCGWTFPCVLPTTTTQAIVPCCVFFVGSRGFGDFCALKSDCPRETTCKQSYLCFSQLLPTTRLNHQQQRLRALFPVALLFFFWALRVLVVFPPQKRPSRILHCFSQCHPATRRLSNIPRRLLLCRQVLRHQHSQTPRQN
jgi:hypothetical protein